jgi:hypothetical protein
MNVALCRGKHKAGHEADGAVAQGAGRAVIMSGCHEEGDKEHRQTQYRDLFPHCETSPSPEGPVMRVMLVRGFFRNIKQTPFKTIKPSLPQVCPSAARPSSLKTRRFPRPSREGVGFVGKLIFY